MSTTLPKSVADLELELLSSVSAGATTATLKSALDSDGNTIPAGKYALTIDLGETNKEYIFCDVSGTAITNVASLSRQGASTSGFANYHRAGAIVALTDWAIIYRILANLTGATGFDSGANLGYDAAPAGLTGNQFATVSYVLGVVNGGAVTFDEQVITNQTAGENLTANDPVYFKEADHKWYKIKANDTTTFHQLKRGIALSTALATASLSIANSGPVSGFTSLTAGSKYYVNNSSAFSTTAGTYKVFMGWALSTTVILLAPQGYAIPYDDEKDALAGTIGTPSSSNKYVTAYSEFIDVDQSQTTQNGTLAVGEADATTKSNKLAQSFIPVYPGTRGFKLYKIADTGTYTGSVKVAVQADSAGSPSGSDLGSVTIANAAWLLIPSAAEFAAEFATELALTPGTLYWVVITSSTADTSNHPNIGYNTGGGYANGSAKRFNTTDGWTSVASADLYFKTLQLLVGQVAIADSTSKQVPSQVLTSGVLDLDITSTTLNTSTTETTVYTKQIPASALRLNSGLHIRGSVAFAMSASGVTSTIKFKLNGNLLATLSAVTDAVATAANIRSVFEFYWLNNNSLSSQKWIALLNGQSTNQNAAASNTNAMANLSDVQTGTTALDTSVPMVLTVTMTNGNNNSLTQFIYNGLVLEKIGM